MLVDRLIRWRDVIIPAATGINMEVWWSKEDDWGCGFGWACRDRVFNEEGLRLVGGPGSRHGCLVPCYMEYTNFEAAVEFFEISFRQAVFICASDSYTFIDKESIRDHIAHVISGRIR